jgi:gamma-glutamyltranspeptidase/glutathione hydrolase
VVESEMVGFAGVAPIMIKMAGVAEVVTIAGLGWWPKPATADIYAGGGAIPEGLGRTVVPAALDALLKALENTAPCLLPKSRQRPRTSPPTALPCTRSWRK